MHNRPRSAATVVGGLLALTLAACGSSTNSGVRPAARLVTTPGSSQSKIVLSSVGAQRIGLTTATARAVPAPTAPVKSHHAKGHQAAPRTGGPTVIVPSSAVIYDPSGKTYAFVSLGRLTFTEVPVVVAYMNGNSAYLRSGPRVGARVVSVGAEELYGVQTGVLGQT
jgi:hypothetical protein